MHIDAEFIRQGLLFYLLLVISITIHEWAHAFTADRLGDNTPASQGRVTLSPLAHLDPIGTGLIPLLNIFVFGGFSLIGWGRPVMINLSNFPPKKRMQCDLLVTLAGPGSNLVIALLGVLLGCTLQRLDPRLPELFSQLVWLNISLAVFNMIPIPPLDGSHVLRYLVGMSEETYRGLMFYGPFVLLIAINTTPVRHGMASAVEWVSQPYGWLCHLLSPGTAAAMFPWMY